MLQSGVFQSFLRFAAGEMSSIKSTTESVKNEHILPKFRYFC